MHSGFREAVEVSGCPIPNLVYLALYTKELFIFDNMFANHFAKCGCRWSGLERRGCWEKAAIKASCCYKLMKFLLLIKSRRIFSSACFTETQNNLCWLVFSFSVWKLLNSILTHLFFCHLIFFYHGLVGKVPAITYYRHINRDKEAFWSSWCGYGQAEMHTFYI